MKDKLTSLNMQMMLRTDTNKQHPKEASLGLPGLGLSRDCCFFVCRVCPQSTGRPIGNEIIEHTL